MSWSWSHTQEAYDAAYANVHKLPKKVLLTILREWAHHNCQWLGKRPSFRLPFNGSKVAHAILADLVWEQAAELRTCDNGGFNCWICPNGCHTVPFD